MGGLEVSRLKSSQEILGPNLQINLMIAGSAVLSSQLIHSSKELRGGGPWPVLEVLGYAHNTDVCQE